MASANPGPLILAGGAEFDGRMAPADRAWLGCLARDRPRLGLMPTANEERPGLAATNGLRHFRGLDTDGEAVMITTSFTASDPQIVAQIERLDAAYMAGGSPLHLARTLTGSPAWQVLARRWRAGMALGGSSAGAMALCERIFVQGQWADGLGIVQGAVVLPHFNNHDEASIEPTRRAMAERGLTGLGIDESTALIWHAGVWRTAGPGRVVVFSAEGANTYRDWVTVAGLPQPATLG